ncbi:uncharacterized protein LOC120336154 [Styela clava]|uniref:uncharacterized protein LOC120336154 n=1 Tax=Styela clava TaxID=7725 RepID=UPI00193AB2E0|nr:uncharacterized protein LOC120336154 [Styela clava]
MLGRTYKVFTLVSLLLFIELTWAEEKRLICKPESDEEQQQSASIDINDDLIKAINSLIDVKMKEVEDKLSQRLWERFMNETESTTAPVEETVVKDERFCHLKYVRKCFTFFKSNLMTYGEAKKRCEDIGGHLGNIYNKAHEEQVVKYIKKNAATPIFFFIGMTIDTKSMNVFLYNRSPAPYVHWYPDGGYPLKEHSMLRYTILPTFSGMFNNVAENMARSNGVLCEF